MRDDYLWDGSGEPDPEIQKMENALGKLRYNRPAPEFPDFARAEAPMPRRGFWHPFSWPQMAGAAAVLLVAATASLLWLKPRSEPPDPATAWDVTRVEGSPQVGLHKIDVAQGTGKLGVGQLLETDKASRAVMRFAAT